MGGVTGILTYLRKFHDLELSTELLVFEGFEREG